MKWKQNFCPFHPSPQHRPQFFPPLPLLLACLLFFFIDFECDSSLLTSVLPLAGHLKDYLSLLSCIFWKDQWVAALKDHNAQSIVRRYSTCAFVNFERPVKNIWVFSLCEERPDRRRLNNIPLMVSSLSMLPPASVIPTVYFIKSLNALQSLFNWLGACFLASAYVSHSVCTTSLFA